jgi:hypothetical protein
MPAQVTDGRSCRSVGSSVPLCLVVAAPGRDRPFVPAGPWLGEVPARSLLYLMTGTAAWAGIAYARATTLVIRTAWRSATAGTLDW